jgi:hypothetical protein
MSVFDMAHTEGDPAPPIRAAPSGLAQRAAEIDGALSEFFSCSR